MILNNFVIGTLVVLSNVINLKICETRKANKAEINELQRKPTSPALRRPVLAQDHKKKEKKMNKSKIVNKNIEKSAIIKDVKSATKPATVSVVSNREVQLSLLHKRGRYNQVYMKEYKKMIASLLPDPESIDPLFNCREMLPRQNEVKTVKSLYSTKKATLPTCSREKERMWKKMKILQLEKKNSVTLKENSRTGARVVEKLMEGQRHYDKEMKFFSHAHHGSTKYFPSFICSAKPKKRNERYSIITDFIDGDKSHVMASIATPEQLRHMVAQFFNSIVELHRVGFIHCDLSPANVMVTRDFDVKLIDFGMAMPVGQANGYRGSFYIRAPELHEMCPGKIDVAIDWWAFGVTVAMWYYYHYNPEALLLTDHTYQFTPMKLLVKGKKFTAGVIPQQFSPELRKFLSLFLTIDPEFRTFSTVRLQNVIRNHEYFRGFDWTTADKS